MNELSSQNGLLVTHVTLGDADFTFSHIREI